MTPLEAVLAGPDGEAGAVACGWPPPYPPVGPMVRRRLWAEAVTDRLACAGVRGARPGRRHRTGGAAHRDPGPPDRPGLSRRAGPGPHRTAPTRRRAAGKSAATRRPACQDRPRDSSRRLARRAGPPWTTYRRSWRWCTPPTPSPSAIPDFDAEDVATRCTAPNIDPERDSWVVADPEGALVGLGDPAATRPGSAGSSWSVYVDPDRGAEVRGPLLARQLDRVAERAAERGLPDLTVRCPACRARAPVGGRADRGGVRLRQAVPLRCAGRWRGCPASRRHRRPG